MYFSSIALPDNIITSTFVSLIPFGGRLFSLKKVDPLDDFNDGVLPDKELVQGFISSPNVIYACEILYKRDPKSFWKVASPYLKERMEERLSGQLYTLTLLDESQSWLENLDPLKDYLYDDEGCRQYALIEEGKHDSLKDVFSILEEKREILSSQCYTFNTELTFHQNRLIDSFGDLEYPRLYEVDDSELLENNPAFLEALKRNEKLH